MMPLTTDLTELPEELRKELAYCGASKYTARDCALAYLASAGDRVTTNDMLIYVYKVTGHVVKRSYLYQMLYRMRKLGLIEHSKPLANGHKTFRITPDGALVARPYIDPDSVSKSKKRGG